MQLHEEQGDDGDGDDRTMPPLDWSLHVTSIGRFFHDAGTRREREDENRECKRRDIAEKRIVDLIRRWSDRRQNPVQRHQRGHRQSACDECPSPDRCWQVRRA